MFTLGAASVRTFTEGAQARSNSAQIAAEVNAITLLVYLLLMMLLLELEWLL